MVVEGVSQLVSRRGMVRRAMVSGLGQVFAGLSRIRRAIRLISRLLESAGWRSVTFKEVPYWTSRLERQVFWDSTTYADVSLWTSQLEGESWDSAEIPTHHPSEKIE
jgi:hypothetical protein